MQPDGFFIVDSCVVVLTIPLIMLDENESLDTSKDLDLKNLYYVHVI